MAEEGVALVCDKIGDFVWKRKTQEMENVGGESSFLFSFYFLFNLINVFIFKDFISLERGEGRGKGRERNTNRLPLAHSQLGTWPATQACALTRNQTGGLSICSDTLPTEPHQSGLFLFFKTSQVKGSLVIMTISIIIGVKFWVPSLHFKMLGSVLHI